jgi:hypothetical protein
MYSGGRRVLVDFLETGRVESIGIDSSTEAEEGLGEEGEISVEVESNGVETEGDEGKSRLEESVGETQG